MAATRTGPPTPPSGRHRHGPQATPAGSSTGHPTAPTRFPCTADALRALTAMADADGLVAVDLRALAAELDLTTVATRALLGDLVEAGALCGVARRVYVLSGPSEACEPPQLPDPDASTASWPASAAPAAGPRTPPHDAVHEGTGSPLLW